jgi:hypothetical protein
MERSGLREWDGSRWWSMREIVRRGVTLERGRRKGKKQVPRYARNDNSRAFRWVVRRVEEGSMAWRRRVAGLASVAGRGWVVGLGFVAGRAVTEVGGIRTVGVGGRAGRGSCGWS